MICVSSRASEPSLSRQRSAIVAMGLTNNALAKWRKTKETARELNLRAGAKETGFSSVTKAGRQMLQILILGAGGALAITQQISPGAIVAGSIILGRALGPIDQIVGSWRGISGARAAWNQIQTAIENDEPKPAYTALPRPEAKLKLDRLFGYVPQDIELLPGTVGENIARMTESDAEPIIDAAKKAGAHEMILNLPQGYETPVGTAGIGSLSAGQRQLIGLARALFGNPVLIVLDEPTANLDPAAVYHAISNLNKAAKSGAIILTATHDPKLIAATSSVMVLRGGSILTAETQQYLAASKPKAANAPQQKLRTVGISA